MLLWTLGYMHLFKLLFLLFLDMYPGVELLGYIVVPVFLFFWETTILFSIGAEPIYVITNSVWGFLFLHLFTNICYLWVFCSVCFVFADSHSDSYEVIPHCGFDVHFPNDLQCWASFHVPVGHLHVLSGKVFICLLPIFNWVVYFFDHFETFM